MRGREKQKGQLGCQVNGAAPGNAAPMLIHSVAPPRHFSAEMPTTHCTGASLDFLGAGVDGGAFLTGFFAQQASPRTAVAGVVDFAAQHGAGFLAQQSAGSVSGGGVCGSACEHPQPLALHASTDPHPHTCAPQEFTDRAIACGTGNPMAATKYAISVTPLKSRRGNARGNGFRKENAMPIIVWRAAGNGQRIAGGAVLRGCEFP